MENFIVSARKYRPATFNMVVGQDTITSTLKNAIKNNHLTQAYLFCGPRGVGKTTCARIFAKTINCSNLSSEGEACDKCESCLSFNSQRSFNIHELDAASNNKVDDIRSLTEQVRIPPQIGRYSVYIIDEVHMLSQSAFNAFLKTLEEPPSHAIFILATTEKHKIIPTILSRCQIFDFNRIHLEDIIGRLSYVAKNEGIEAEDEALHVIAQKADGALRDALSIFDQVVSLCGKSVKYRDVIENLNVLDYEYYFRTVDAALRGDLSDILLTFNEILENGFDGHNFVSGLNNHLRDLLVSRDEATIKLLETTPSVRQRYLRQTSGCSLDFLYKALEAGSNCEINYKSSKNQRLHVELFLIQLCRLASGTGEELQKKNDRPEKKIKAEAEIPLPPKSEILRENDKPAVRSKKPAPHIYHEEKQTDSQSKSFSVREVISDDEKPAANLTAIHEPEKAEQPALVKAELDYDSFEKAWKEFADSLKGEGTRVISMFKSIRPEIINDQLIKLHMTNAAQKDLFIQNYKQRLKSFIAERFQSEDVEIESVVESSETNEIIYTDEQKYTYLVNKYPMLKELKKTFNLDLL